MLTAFLVATACGLNPSLADEAGMRKHLRLLTTQQYVNTIQYFFGTDIRIEARFSPVPRTEGLLMAGTSVAGLSDAQIEIYQKISRLVSAQVVDARRRETLFPCRPKTLNGADAACARKFLNRVIDNLYFVQPPEEHISKLVAEAGTAADGLQDFYSGIQITLEGMLLSPSVLFVAENEEPDPNRDGYARLDSYSQAARLSLFLWNAAPGPELLAAAKRGDLFNVKKRERIVDDMLASDRTNQGVRSFFDDMFHLEGMETLNKDSAIYPYFIGAAASDAREQTLRTVVDHLMVRNEDYRDLFTSSKTFLSASLGVIYDVPVMRGWTPYEFPPEAHRAGILTQPSFLAMNSHATRSSATFRGKALRESILCQTVPPPPANVDFGAVENPDPSLKTARDRINFHLKNPVCAGCHKITDPIGLAFEKFDGTGRYRETENGAQIDTSGAYDGKTYSGIEGLGQALHDSPALPACLVRRIFSYATAALVPVSEKSTLDKINKDFSASGYRLRPLLRKIVMDPAFSYVNQDAPPPVPGKAAQDILPLKTASNH
jgi:Protein of unknown function (DUF1588)/Protein of unknown function (DUF1592)/Protein of unknown function (DUF1585)